MSLSSQRFSATHSSLITFHRHPLKSPSVFNLPTAPPHFRVLVAKPLGSKLLVPTRCSRLGVHHSKGVVRRNRNGFNFGSLLSIPGFVFLSMTEFVCVVWSSIWAIFFAIAGWQADSHGVGLTMVVGGVLVGALIRRRQWSRACMESVEKGVENFNLVDKIERLEHDAKSFNATIMLLSRQLEKLGTMFQVARKSMNDPIAETVALAQKNYEATSALAAQKDNLEKELCEIHNALLVMQEQQHKQLKLIIAIGKARNLVNDEEVPEQESDRKENPQPAGETLKQTETKPLHQDIGEGGTQS